MKAITFFIFIGFLIANITATSQNNYAQNFDNRVKLAQQILEKQPTSATIKGILTDGYGLDSANATGFYITCPDKIQIVAYLYLGTERTVAVGFYEKNDAKKEIYDFTVNELKYTYIASEHMCDYYTKEKSSILFCPDLDNGLMVYIEKIN
jgi:hypothetical protein